jgi:glycine betaine/proline transport system substrate-binding protein
MSPMAASALIEMLNVRHRLERHHRHHRARHHGFEGLGYSTSTTIASVPISLAGLRSKQIDVSLGYWSPVQDAIIEPMVKARSLTLLPTPNLSGAKATLAVPAYAAEAGLKSFADIAKFQKELDGKIYGIEAGSSANAKLQAMIDKNEMGLGGFKLVQSSEAGMLAECSARSGRSGRWSSWAGSRIR